MESVIISNPILWMLYGAALFLCVIGLIKKLGNVVYIIAAALAVSATIYALLLGMSLYEAATVMTVFLCINLIPYIMRKGGG